VENRRFQHSRIRPARPDFLLLCRTPVFALKKTDRFGSLSAVLAPSAGSTL
jgi:hypothetical protein